jgi:LysM repeat protein
MRSKRYLIGLVAMLVTMLTLAACVRPVPQPDPTPIPEVDPGLVMTQLPLQPDQFPTPVDETLPVATPAPAEPTVAVPPVEEPAQDQIHVVQPGDTLFVIASQYGATIDSIIIANDIQNPDALEVGQELLIPAPGSEVVPPTAEVVAGETPEATPGSGAGEGTHVVQAGENLYRIGLKYGCSVEQMATANDIINPSHIAIGQILQVPDCS